MKVRGLSIGLQFAAVLALAGCSTFGTTKVATDVQVVDKPVAVPCEIKWPPEPKAYVSQVQLTGSPAVDAVLVERAKEAELEERIAYEAKLVAAMTECAKKSP